MTILSSGSETVSSVGVAGDFRVNRHIVMDLVTSSVVLLLLTSLHAPLRGSSNLVRQAEVVVFLQSRGRGRAGCESDLDLVWK